MTDFLLLIVGLAGLWLGSETLIRGAMSGHELWQERIGPLNAREIGFVMFFHPLHGFDLTEERLVELRVLHQHP